LNCDHFAGCGGIEVHVDALKRVGYTKAEAVKDGRTGIAAAFK
jgi:hypothetical protein